MQQNMISEKRGEERGARKFLFFFMMSVGGGEDHFQILADKRGRKALFLADIM